jgi:predicted nucleic acid-binding protein
VILIDTGPLVALCDAKDSRHRAAVAQMAALAGTPLGTCDAVLTEACVHLPHRAQRDRLRAMLERLDVAPVAVPAGRTFWTDVLGWLVKYADHEPDWADACLAVLSGRDEALKVWTYDEEFRTMWRRPNGTRIPLVGRT